MLSFRDKPKYAGIDLHKRTSFITLMDKKGQIHAQVNLDSSDPARILYVIKSTKGIEVAVEATMNWYWMIELLQEQGIPVSLVNPIKMKIISTSHKKTDKNDTRLLAEGLKNDSPLAYIPSTDIRDLRELVRWRMRLVKTNRTIKNHIHQVILKLNLQAPYKSIFCVKGKIWLKELDIREPYKSQILMNLELLEKQNEQIKVVEDRMKEAVKDTISLELLKSIPGISDTLGITFLAQIGDIARFDNPDSFCAYAGLVPKTHASGEHRYQGRIIKQSDAFLRTALSDVILHTIKKDTSIHDIYEKILPENKKEVLKLVFDKLTVKDGTLIYKYSYPFKLIYKAVKGINAQSSKVIIYESESNLKFENMKIRTMKGINGALMDGHPIGLDRWDDFRNFSWIEEVKYPEYAMKVCEKILSV